VHVKSWLLNNHSVIVAVPDIHHFDPHNHLIIMEDCGSDTKTLDEFLRSPNTSSSDVGIIGTALGEFAALLHWSQGCTDRIREGFNANLQAKEMAAYGAYKYSMDTVQLTAPDIPPSLLDPRPIEVDKQLLEIASDVLNGLHCDAMSSSADQVVSLRPKSFPI